MREDSNEAAEVVIAYKASPGAKNTFEIDIVFKMETDTSNLPSPIDSDFKIQAASIENIVVDKLSACAELVLRQKRGQ